MATTHVFAGLTVVAPVAYAAPEFAVPLAAGAIGGGLAPDFDLVLEHRRNFHFPILGVPIAALAVACAVLAPSSATVALAAVAVVAWLHAASDALGGGPEMDPWTNPGDRGVYDHVRGRWIRPRRWIRYDGAPEDGVAAVALAAAPLLVFEGWIAGLIVGGIGVSAVYVLLRRRLVVWAPDWLE